MGGSAESGDVEVTPEMIEAGLDAYYSHDPEGRGEAALREALGAVFRSMIEASGSQLVPSSALERIHNVVKDATAVMWRWSGRPT
jgi:DNA gyrase inhibitor GyrI